MTTSNEFSESWRRPKADDLGRSRELVVINALNDWACTECSGTGALMLLEGPGPLCMACADLDHLVFLPRGNTALTRRAKKASRLSAVVIRFSRARKRYERQGLLVEEAALAHAEAECLADEDARESRRRREAERRERHDAEFERAFAAAVLAQFPGCPASRAEEIAVHSTLRGSSRVARTAAGRALDPGAVRLAVATSVRHLDTQYDDLLMSGADRAAARGPGSGGRRPNPRVLVRGPDFASGRRLTLEHFRAVAGLASRPWPVAHIRQYRSVTNGPIQRPCVIPCCWY